MRIHAWCENALTLIVITAAISMAEYGTMHTEQDNQVELNDFVYK